MRRILIIIAAHVLFFGSYAQSNLLFENYHSNGLSSHEVRSIFKDNQGFLWLATENGISRFDGLHFDNFNETSGHGFSKSLTEARFVTGDDKGNLWVASDGV